MLIIVIILGILVIILGSGDIYWYKKYEKSEKSRNKYVMMAVAYKALEKFYNKLEKERKKNE